MERFLAQLFNGYWAIQVFYFFLSELWQLVSFKKFDHFNWFNEYIAIKLFIMFFYYPFNICRNYSDDTTIIPDIDNFCLSFF